jgi:molybdopterin-guanine dinucleotide biosynthesis protein A
MLGALILAGGEGKRFRKNKALIKLNDKPLLLYVVEKALELTREVVVVIGKNDRLDRYTALLPAAVTVVRDVVEGRGPLAGIYTGMQKMFSEFTTVLPCDSPFIKIEIFNYLFNKAKNVDAAIPRWPTGYIEPLHAVYRTSPAFSAAETALKNEELRILAMIKRLDKVVYVDVNEIRKFDYDLLTFFNINNQEDLKVAEMMMRGKREFPIPFSVRLCSDKAAFEIRIQRKISFDLMNLEKTLKSAKENEIIVSTPHILIFKTGPAEVTLSRTGRMLIKRVKDENDAAAVAQRILRFVSKCLV